LAKIYSVPALESSACLTYRVQVGRIEPEPCGFAQTRTQRRLRFWSSILRPLNHRCRRLFPSIGLSLSMVALNTIELSVVLPSDDMRLVMMQPYITLDTQTEPFVWPEAVRDRQLDRVRRTLSIAKNVGAQFTLLPEYSVPGLAGIQVIDDEVADDRWHSDSIVIAGIDGLNREEYRQLCSLPNTVVDQRNDPSRIGENEWINCAIICAKSSDGAVIKWVQPKITPSWPEEAIVANQMFRGKTVFLFEAKFANETQCHFMTLICFDWIGSEAGNGLLWEILKTADHDSNPIRKDMNMLFVLQHNPKPNHPMFLENARRYFDEQTQFPFIPRTQGAVVFANTAGGSEPGKHQEYGSSAIVFSRIAPYDSTACPPSGAVMTNKLRNSETLRGFKESLLRESGPCIHSIRLTLPQFINLGPGGRALPIKGADVYAIDHGLDDRRTPGAPVPAIVKWINDELDTLPNLLANEEHHPLRATLSQTCSNVCNEVRQQGEGNLLTCMELAAVRIRGNKWICVSGREMPLVDYWDQVESACLKAVIDVMSVVDACRELMVTCAPVHGMVVRDHQIFDIIVVTGTTHKECFEYVKSKLKSNGQRIRIIVTKDSNNTLVTDKDKSITVVSEADPQKGPSIYDPEWHHGGHQNIISACRDSDLMSDLDRQIKELLKL
jgi:hypothetical protein